MNKTEMANAQLNMIPGHRYRFTYRSDAQRKDHTSVLAYLGEDKDDYVLNARPYAGTQNLPKCWVKNIEHVAMNTPLMIDSRVLR